MLSDYQEMVFNAALKHELRASFDFYYEIWESMGYLVIISKVKNDENINILGRVTVTKDRIFGSNPIIISELEKALENL